MFWNSCALQRRLCVKYVSWWGVIGQSVGDARCAFFALAARSWFVHCFLEVDLPKRQGTGKSCRNEPVGSVDSRVRSSDVGRLRIVDVECRNGWWVVDGGVVA